MKQVTCRKQDLASRLAGAAQGAVRRQHVSYDKGGPDEQTSPKIQRDERDDADLKHYQPGRRTRGQRLRGGAKARPSGLQLSMHQGEDTREWHEKQPENEP